MSFGIGSSRSRVSPGHDYCPGGRKPAWESTVALQKAQNIHLIFGVLSVTIWRSSEGEF
jgi:hypothetical protein